MCYKSLTLISIFIISSLLFNCAKILRKGPEYETKKEQKLATEALKKANKCIKENISNDYQGPIPVNSKIDSVTVNLSQLQLNVWFSRHFSYQPLRPENVNSIYKLFKKYLGRKFKNFNVTLNSLNYPIETLVPNYFRADTSRFDKNRLPQTPIRSITPIVQRLNKKNWTPTNGLFNHNIALWHSHGFYYSFERERWEWQRPRLFNTVEDLLPMSFVIPYIVPMLENAGAAVFLPRERDLQTKEIIIDNDSFPDSSNYGQYLEINAAKWDTGTGDGFSVGNPPYPANLNPFRQGSYRISRSDTNNSALAAWIPNIPETEMYGVYISYFASEENVPDARYTVYHSGGTTEFLVNQQIGGNTWVYLGKFKFKKGFDPRSTKVILQNKSAFSNKIVSADAVRFGGGMGNILRDGRVSGYPRFAEAARYYLQYAGMPDTLVYNLHKDSTDYKDDYKSRGEFINYLIGRPFGPNKNRDVKGLGIPIDLSLAFHTDAGIDTNDTTIGTLMIYSILDADSQAVFPDGMSRLANRDLADIMQTQIVNDIRQKYRPNWRRRALRNGDYSEAYRPNAPACLLELLAHQNFTDMKYALSPQFRFDISRAIYKGMLKFIATQYGYQYVVQPLPVSHFHAFLSDSAEVTLQWKAVTDPLEPTAAPEKYVVYTQIEDNGFDNGALVNKNQFVLKKLKKGVIYSFKVSAANKGGESFPSEILSVCWINNHLSPILVVNGFDRVAPPEFINKRNFKGFANFIDAGVPDKYDLNFTGAQFDFDVQSPYKTNDAPGHGNSRATFETEIMVGNTFNYPYIHGSSIKNCGCSFVSASDEALMDGDVDLKKYKIIDLILGEEKTTIFPTINDKISTSKKLNYDYQTFPEKLQTTIKKFCKQGGNLFVSGAYVGKDLLGRKESTKKDSLFAQKILKIKWQTGYAATTGNLFCTDSLFLPRFTKFQFNTNVRPDIYTVESPDAIDPAEGAKTILRYSENRFSAATAYFGNYSVIVFGFPFETIIDEKSRNEVMKAVLNKFNIKKR